MSVCAAAQVFFQARSNMRPEALLRVIVFALAGVFVQGITLSSSVESENGHVTVCPDTNITFTCSDTLGFGMRWFALPLLNEDNSPGLGPNAPDIGDPTPVEYVDEFTITLLDRQLMMGDNRGNYTSTLDVVVNDRIQNGTNVTCFTPNVASLLILKKEIPPPPSNVKPMTQNYSREEFTILITWDDQNADSYMVSVNSTTNFFQKTTTFTMRGEYNILYKFTVKAVNCAAFYSDEVTANITIAGCGPPSPPVNGSVGELTSSRVGAQATYSCDTHLVLVGETVATCSLPSLTWLPSSGDVTCVQPPGMTTAVVTTSSTPSIHSTSPRSSIGVIAGSVLASLFLVGIIVVTLIVLAFVYSGRLKKWKVSRVGEENCYGAQEMLMRPGSSTGTLSVSTSPPPHSPRAALPSYDVVTTTGSSVPYYSHADPTTKASGNGSSSTVVYSETNESMRRVVASHSTDDGLVTSHQPTLPSQYSTMGPTSLQAPQGEKYAELVFESSGGPPMPSLDTLVPPVKYTMVKPSKKPHPKSPRPDPEHSAGSQSAVGPDKHPLDRRITIDMAIQQLQQLTPYWWAVGEAAGMQRAALKEIQAHYKGDAKESFAEVMHQIFIPDHTTWTQLAGLCEGVGFADLATALLDSYTTGVLPVAIEEDEDTLRPPPTKPAPPIPPRGTVQDEDQDLPPSLPPPLSPDDIPPSLPPPLAPEDIPPSPPPPLAPEDVPLSVPPPPLRAEAPPPRPPKASKPPAVPPRH